MFDIKVDALCNKNTQGDAPQNIYVIDFHRNTQPFPMVQTLMIDLVPRYANQLASPLYVH